MEIDYVAAKFWFDIIQTLGIIGIGIYTAWAGRNRVTSKRISALDKKYDTKFEAFKEKQKEKCSKHHERTAKVEVELKGAPNHKDLGEIHEKINDVNGSLKELSGQLKGMNNNVSLIHEHLLNGD